MTDLIKVNKAMTEVLSPFSSEAGYLISADRAAELGIEVKNLKPQERRVQTRRTTQAVERARAEATSKRK